MIGFMSPAARLTGQHRNGCDSKQDAACALGIKVAEYTGKHRRECGIGACDNRATDDGAFCGECSAAIYQTSPAVFGF